MKVILMLKTEYGVYSKHTYWSAIKRYYWNLLFLILPLALLYISVQLHQ